MLADARGGAADVEGAHRQLRARLADGLRRDHTDRFAASTSRPVARLRP